MDETGQKHTNRKIIAIELTDEELLFKVADSLTPEEILQMLYSTLSYFSNLYEVLDSADTTMLQ